MKLKHRRSTRQREGQTRGRQMTAENAALIAAVERLRAAHPDRSIASICREVGMNAATYNGHVKRKRQREEDERLRKLVGYCAPQEKRPQRIADGWTPEWLGAELSGK